MGLFDFFRRKPDEPAKQASSEEDRLQPRCIHYTFAHYALRTAAHENPLAFIAILASPDALKFLASLLNSVSEYCKEEAPSRSLQLDDFTIHCSRLGQYPCAIVEMPQPLAPTEAYFVAAILLANLEQEIPDLKNVELRYFTLENGIRLGGPPRTVLCEWTKDGAHCNYGDGPPPRVQDFLETLKEMISKS